MNRKYDKKYILKILSHSDLEADNITEKLEELLGFSGTDPKVTSIKFLNDPKEYRLTAFTSGTENSKDLCLRALSEGVIEVKVSYDPF